MTNVGKGAVAMLTLYFDLDGVLANYEAGVRAHGVPYVPMGKSTPKDTATMYGQLSKIPHFFYTLPPIAGTVQLFMQLKTQYHCEILTAIPKPKWGFVGAAEDKCAWVVNYLGADVKVNVVTREEKLKFCKGKDCVLIDDMKINVDAWNAAGGTGILFTGPVTLANQLSVVINGLIK